MPRHCRVTLTPSVLKKLLPAGALLLVSPWYNPRSSCSNSARPMVSNLGTLPDLLSAML